MMHPPVSPGNNAYVNGGKVGSERDSIDGRTPPAINEKASGKPAETVGNCREGKVNSVGKTEKKDAGLTGPGITDDSQPPRSSPANISDLRLPLTQTTSGSEAGGFVPLQLTSPTESVDQKTKTKIDSTKMAAKSATETRSAVDDKKSSQPKSGQTNGSTSTLSPPTTPRKDDKNAPPDQAVSMSPTLSSPQSKPSSTTTTPPPSSKSGAPYIDDSDSEDEEIYELLTQKRNQIRADILAYQKSKELELTIYEKRLRDEQMRKKRRKLAMANGYPATSGSPRTYYSLNTKQAIGNLPGYLPLTPNPTNNAPPKPSGLRKMVEAQDKESPPSSETSQAASTKTAEPSQLVSVTTNPEAKPEIKVKSPTNSPAPKEKPPKPSPSISPVTSSPKLQNTSQNVPNGSKLSVSALKALDTNEKPITMLPSSLKSTSSWTSGSGKDSRRSSVADNKAKKNKRVVFQLEVEGDWFRVKPSGEEVPMDSEERDRLRAVSAALDAEYDSDTESDFLEFKVPSKSSKSPMDQNPGYQPIEELEGVGSSALKSNRGPEDPDWVSTRPPTEEPAPISSSKSTISDDSLDDDVFDLDEELPYEPPTAPQEFRSGSLEDSVMSLGLPLAPPPPPPPGGSGLNLPNAFGVGRAGGSSFADTLAYIQAYQQAGISRGSSTSGSYLSSSFPRNSFGGTSGSSWRDSAAPPRPSSSHGTSAAPAVPIAINRRASGGLDLVTAPTLEMLSSSTTAGTSTQALPIMSGSLPASSGFRRRSVTKYDIPDEEIKDNSASSSVTSKSDSNPPTQVGTQSGAPLAMPQFTTTSKTASSASSLRASSDSERKASPYGTSAPISIPLRHTPAAPASQEQINAPEQVNDDVPKEVVSGRPSPTSNTAEKSNQPTTAKARPEAQKKPVVSPTPVEKVLEATTQALSKSSLPSSMGGKSKREHKSRSGSSTPKYGSYGKKSPSSRSRKPDANPVKPEPWHETVVQSFPANVGNQSLALDAAQAVSSPSWNGINSSSLLSSSLPKFASGTSTSSFATNPITALPGVKSYSPTAPSITNSSNSPRKGPITLSSGPRYASAVAEQAAAAVEANGLASASVVGGVDGRSGLDASAITSNSSLRFTDIGPASLKESLGNFKPESLSFSMRLALEDEEAAEVAGKKN